MKRDTINYLMVGSVVSLAFVLLLYVLYRLSGGVNENDRYHVFYAKVGGLSEGTPVTYEGYKLGSVVAIVPAKQAGKTRYRVDLRIRDGWQIPADSVARIYSEGLLAETVINIEEGASAHFLSPGTELMGRQGVDLFSALSVIADEVGGLAEHSIRPLLDNLNARINRLGDDVGERLPQILDGMQLLVGSLQDSAERVNRILDNRAEAKLVRTIDNSEQMAANLLQLSEGLLEVKREADVLLTNSNALVQDNQEDLRLAMIALRRSLEEVAAYTDSILRNMEGASRNMNEFSRQIRDNPGLLLGGSAPREEGVRGE